MTHILPMAEALEREYRTDDIKLLGLLEDLAGNDDIKGLLEAVAKMYVNRTSTGGHAARVAAWVSNAIDDKVKEEMEANDAKQSDSPVDGRGYRLREPE
jgi:hypothetical protein